MQGAVRKPDAAEQKKSEHQRQVIKLSPFYHSAVNAITEPNRLVFCSRYLIERWSPLLGGTGLQLLLYLRMNCFHDRRTGECRNVWQISRAELAHAIGVSEATVKRELGQNLALRQFVQPQQEYRLSGGRGGVRRDANSYRVAMDDPIHDQDWPRVEAYIRQSQARTEKGKESENSEAAAAKRRAKQSGAKDAVAPGHFDPAQNEVLERVAQRARGVKMTQEGGQNDPTLLKEYLWEDTSQELTLNVGKNDDFTSSFGQEDYLSREVSALVEELRDWGSERRHRQLLSLCDQHGLTSLAQQALAATRKRQAREGKSGPLEKPGAYYHATLIKLLEEKQVFVPKATNEDDPEEVRRLVRASLGTIEN